MSASIRFSNSKRLSDTLSDALSAGVCIQDVIRYSTAFATSQNDGFNFSDENDKIRFPFKNERQIAKSFLAKS